MAECHHRSENTDKLNNVALFDGRIAAHCPAHPTFFDCRLIAAAAVPALATEASWPLQAQGADAQACLQALGGSPAWDWLVVDHYGLGPPWETAMRAATHRLLAIDDLARAHDCDVLLDVNHFEHAQARYQGRLPAAAVVLTGPRYALLRPDFESHRRDVQPRSGPVRRLLILLGGMDADNVTGRAIEAIDCLPQARDIDVDVVIGAAHPARALLESLAASRPRLYLHVQSNEIAALCARADLAIGAGGGTTWERCCLGLPTLALCLAPNQREVLAAGAHPDPEDPPRLDPTSARGYWAAYPVRF